ncbi:acyltransferase domain-containing protein [Dactylosporangium sp. NPDC005572]|uniref:acyltransferase domain-containing protein n=1 Tax=Dactylosporangium sp. NPDC005572 TaxID=3156889 RepID=UPI00339E9FED
MAHIDETDLPREGPDVVFPGDAALPDALLDLAVPHEDVNAVLRLLRRLPPDLAALRDRCVWAALAGVALPPLPEHLAVFYVGVAVAAVPHARARHAGRGVPPEVAAATLRDVGRQVTRHRRRHGVPGIANPQWLAKHLRGELVELGRLQFEPARLGNRTGTAVAAAGGPGGPGTPSLELHIPDFRGPLTPAAVDDSLEKAHAFFDDTPFTVAACHSWLLDPQLPGVLPESSNIVAFQRRFTPAYRGPAPEDDLPLAFVFDDPAVPRARLPRDTALRRALLDHLDAGGHWYAAAGWFRW